MGRRGRVLGIGRWVMAEFVNEGKCVPVVNAYVKLLL